MWPQLIPMVSGRTNNEQCRKRWKGQIIFKVDAKLKEKEGANGPLALCIV
jgi:hypothetical protein